jgi:hypothetical protein
VRSWTGAGRVERQRNEVKLTGLAPLSHRWCELLADGMRGN